MHFDWVKSVEEFNFLELENEFSEDLFAQKGSFFFVVEKDDSE